MKTGRFAQLRGYFNKQYFHSKVDKNFLVERNGNDAYCYSEGCNRQAQGVLMIKAAGGHFNIPACKWHFRQAFPRVTIFPTIAQWVKVKKLRRRVYRSSKLVYIQYPK